MLTKKKSPLKMHWCG